MAKNPAGQEFWLTVNRPLTFFSFCSPFSASSASRGSRCLPCSHSSCNLALNSSCTSILLLFIFLYLIIHFIPYPCSPFSFSYLLPPLLSLCSIPCLSSELCIYLSSLALLLCEYLLANTFLPFSQHCYLFRFSLIQVTVKEKRKTLPSFKAYFQSWELLSRLVLQYAFYVWLKPVAKRSKTKNHRIASFQLEETCKIIKSIHPWLSMHHLSP